MRCRLCEEGSVLLSIENLLSYEWVQAGRLCLHAVYYDLGRARLALWNSETEDFEEVPALHSA